MVQLFRGYVEEKFKALPEIKSNRYLNLWHGEGAVLILPTEPNLNFMELDWSDTRYFPTKKLNIWQTDSSTQLVYYNSYGKG